MPPQGTVSKQITPRKKSFAGDPLFALIRRKYKKSHLCRQPHPNLCLQKRKCVGIAITFAKEEGPKVGGRVVPLGEENADDNCGGRDACFPSYYPTIGRRAPPAA